MLYIIPAKMLLFQKIYMHGFGVHRREQLCHSTAEYNIILSCIIIAHISHQRVPMSYVIGYDCIHNISQNANKCTYYNNIPYYIIYIYMDTYLSRTDDGNNNSIGIRIILCFSITQCCVTVTLHMREPTRLREYFDNRIDVRWWWLLPVTKAYIFLVGGSVVVTHIVYLYPMKYWYHVCVTHANTSMKSLSTFVYRHQNRMYRQIGIIVTGARYKTFTSINCSHRRNKTKS